MLKVDNKKVINDLAKTTYKANRKRNILTIVAIFLTTFLLCTVISIGLCYWDTVSLRQQRMQGVDYDIELTEPRDEQVSIMREMDNVEYAGLSVKCAIISKFQDRELDKVQLFWLDDICWEKQTIPALDHYTGTYPTKENELMLSKSALNSMGIKNPKIGMKLPLLYQNLSDNQTNEDTTKTFVLSGWFLDYTGKDKGYVSEDFYKTTGALPTDLTQGTLKISLKNPLYTENDIIEMQNQIKLSANQIIVADYDTISNFIKTIVGLLVLLGLVFLSGYLFIYNTLYISVNRDIRYFGQLKTIGTTSVQIRKMIYKQMLWNAVIGIPLGLFGSAIVGKIVIPQLLHALNPAITASDVETVSLWVFVLATIFSFATTMISSQKPVKIAMNCSSIEAMKYIGTASVKVKSKKRTGGDIRSMVTMNLFRDKKQFVIIMCSFSLAVSLFLIINVVIHANNAKNILNHTYDYDLRLLNQTLLSDNEKLVITSDLIEQIKSIDGVKDVRVLKSATAVVPYQENVYGEYYKELYSSRYTPGDYEKDMELYKKQPDYVYFTCRIVGIDDLEFEKINNTLKNPLNKEKFKNGEVAFVSKSFTQGDNGIVGKNVEFSIPTALNPNEKEVVKTGAVIDNYPAYYSAGYTPDLIVSADFFENIVEQPLIEMLKIDYDESFSKSTESSIKGLMESNELISTDSKLDRYSEMKNSENQITVLGGSIGIIIMLLAISNYLNMMSESIQNRSKEFAILESVGMTRKQIKKMIVFESLCYAILSIIISLIIGIPMSYMVYTNFNIYSLPFEFPVLKNLLLFLIIIITCVATSLFVFSKSKGETIIELLRRNEI
ncbi:ABC transporter permease [Blautia pseudococcoides]|uniref:ABC transporter permease n=1 Tax=Blautia pseudococcoides TaxID=1796616 RepID=UPI00148AEB67|nr:ABC transporter permease [Blautia pseudococcoides]QJU14297.1 ABC transporter permease [Blautia pseudococcoides]